MTAGNPTASTTIIAAMKHTTALLPILLSLSACQTQPSKRAGDDFWWTERTVAATTEQVFHGLQDGFRQCTHWTANCFLTDGHAGASCDVFRRAIDGGTREPMGIVTVAPANHTGESIVRAGSIKPPSVRRDSHIYQGRRSEWLSLAEGATCK